MAGLIQLARGRLALTFTRPYRKLNLCCNKIYPHLPPAEPHLGLEPGQLDRLHDVSPGLVLAERVLAPGDVAGVVRVLSEEVQGPRVEEVLAVLHGGGSGHDVEMSITDPAVGSVVPVVLEVLQGVGRHQVAPLALVQHVKLVRPDQLLADG